jgi:hypothetical protein
MANWSRLAYCRKKYDKPFSNWKIIGKIILEKDKVENKI